MRKNFTQLFMGLALIVGYSTMGYSQCDIDPPPGSIYNFQFDGGLEGWTARDAGGFETTIGWNWSETGDLTMGAYGPTNLTEITSESVCNGAMVMDSDFLDNAGIAGNFENGPCPAPCNGYLVSPVMDFSNAALPVELSFYQALRQFDSEFYIYISYDGGTSNADTMQINEQYPLNSNHIMEEVVMPLCGLQGEANVVVTFHYVGNYYYWAIDDVNFGDARDDVDMRVNSNFYTKVTNYATPKNMGTTVPILADIENLRAYESPASTLNYRVRDDFMQELFSASRAYDPVPGCSTDENKLFASSYTMPNEVGFYSIEFEIDAADDLNQDNDIITAPFKITDREFRKLPTDEEYGEEDYIGGFRYGAGLISWGSQFYFPQNEDNQGIEYVTLGYSTSATDSVPSPGVIAVAIYEWVDFNDNGAADEGERRLLGEESILIPPNSPPDQTFTVTPLSNETGDLIRPAPGTQILVVGHTNPFNEETNYFFRGVDENSYPEFSASANNLAFSEAGLLGGSGHFANNNGATHEDRHDRTLFNVDGGVIWDISIGLDGEVSTEDINEDISVSLYPSPASEKVNVELNLEEVSKKVSIELTDMAGNRAGIYNFSNIKNDNLSIDVSEYPGGMYLMNIRTEAGMISKKISVIH